MNDAKRYEEFQKAVFEGALEGQRLDAQQGCCRFHDAGGTFELACGGDTPTSEGKHSRSCAYLAGGDCTCGHAVPDEEY